MALLDISPITVNKATFGASNQRKVMYAEHSTLGSPKLRNQLYDDAADVGIALRSEDTGRVTHWYLYEELTQAEEVMGWVFRPTWETVNRFPRLAGWEVKIYND